MQTNCENNIDCDCQVIRGSIVQVLDSGNQEYIVLKQEIRGSETYLHLNFENIEDISQCLKDLFEIDLRKLEPKISQHTQTNNSFAQKMVEGVLKKHLLSTNLVVHCSKTVVLDKNEKYEKIIDRLI